MDDRTLRLWLRWSHILIASVLLIYLYSPLRLDDSATFIIRLLVMPALIFTGFIMWQQFGWAKFGGKN
jgi:hypothetical protein